MPGIYFEVRKGKAYIYEAIDGDFSRLELIDDSPDPAGAMFSATKYKIGRPLTDKNMPTRIRLEGASRPPFDIDMCRSSMLLNTKARDIVERLEPGVHQFWPMQIEHKRHGNLGEKYFLVPCNRIDSINRELTTPALEPPFSYKYVGATGARLVLDKEKIGNRHIWIESFVMNQIFLSDALMEALTEAGCTGWQNGVPAWRERWTLEAL